MVVLRKRDNCIKQGKNQNQNAALPKVEHVSRKNSFPGSAAGLDILLWLKGVALDLQVPEASKDSDGELWNQTLKLREVLCVENAECQQRKRELEQDVRGKNSAATGLASKNSNAKNVKKLKLDCRHCHSVLCLSNMTVPTECFNQPTAWNSCSSSSILTSDSGSQLMKQLCNDSNASDNATDQGPLTKGISSVDTDELVCHLNQFSSENFIVQDPPLVDSNDLISCSHSSSSEEKTQQADKLFATESEGENLPRPVIPIGPKFQAEVPEWTGPVNKRKLYGCDGDSETLKFLGTKIWPTEKTSRKRDMKVIGSGRSESCSCVSPGSADCIKCHTHSARLALQSELGPAFSSWKFDEMGAAVSKKWTMKDQCIFESLIKNYPLSSGMDFWERALKLFPSKCKKSILSYYYNVYNPKRIAQQTRSSLDQVDSDEDHVDYDDRDDNEDRAALARGYKASTLLKRF